MAVVFVKRSVMETKGKSLQEIEIALLPQEYRVSSWKLNRLLDVVIMKIDIYIVHLCCFMHFLLENGENIHSP